MKKTDLCEKIEELKKQGKTYSEIAKELDCSKGTISYYLNSGQKEKSLNRQRKNRSKNHPFVTKRHHFIRNRKLPIKQMSNIACRNLLFKKIWTFKNAGKGKNMKTDFSVQEVIDKFGDNPKCYLTGIEIDIYNTKSYEFDHIIPVSRGGTNELSNLGICSAKANRAKGNMTPDEFINLCRLVVSNVN